MPVRFTAAVLVIPLAAACSSLCFAAQYTASPDRQSGTLTIESAFKRLKAGDTLVLRGGTYWSPPALANRKGTKRAPIVIRAHPLETPVFDYSHPPGALKWRRQESGGPVYVASCKVDPVWTVYAGGKPVRRVKDAKEMKPGTFRYSRGKIYLHTPNGAHPDKSNTVIAASREGLVFDSCEYVQLIGVTVRYAWLRTIFLKLSHYCLIAECDVEGGESPIFVGRDVSTGGSTHLEIRDCRIWRKEGALYTWKEDKKHKKHKKFQGDDHGAVDIREGSHYAYVHHNEIWGTFDGVRLCTGENVQNVLIEYNDIHDVRDDGIELDAVPTGGVNVARNNYIHDSEASGVSLQPGCRAHVYNNIIYNIKDMGLKLGNKGDYPQKVFAHNLILDVGRGLRLMTSGKPSSDLSNYTVVGNIIVGRKAVDLRNKWDRNNVFDYNALREKNSGPSQKHPLSVPKLKNVKVLDFRPVGALGKVKAIDAVKIDFLGRPRLGTMVDAGPFEMSAKGARSGKFSILDWVGPRKANRIRQKK